VEWRVWLEVLGQSPVCNTPFFDIFMSRQRIYQVGANTGTDSAVGFGLSFGFGFAEKIPHIKFFVCLSYSIISGIAFLLLGTYILFFPAT